MYNPKGNVEDYELVDDAPHAVGPWETTFAWMPVRIGGKRYWLTEVSRRIEEWYVESVEGHVYVQLWRYGTLFDVLRTVSVGKPTPPLTHYKKW